MNYRHLPSVLKIYFSTNIQSYMVSSFCLFLGQNLTIYSRLVSNLLCSPGWLWTHELLVWASNDGITLTFFFFFLVVLEFELKVLHLPRQHSAVWATPTIIFALGIFQIGSHFYAQVRHCDPPIYTSSIAGMTGVCHHAQCFYWSRWCFLDFFAPAALEPWFF
jgi:hypothetical protein